jgi:hypothetical protein
MTDQELIVHTIREVTLMASEAIEPAGRDDLVTRLLAVLGRGDVGSQESAGAAIRDAPAPGGSGLIRPAQCRPRS